MPRMECSRYINVTDNGRYWDSYGPLSSQCGDVNHTTQWSRFITDSITDAMIPEGCPSMSSSKNISLKNVPCGAVYRGWINGQHPTAAEGNFVDCLKYKVKYKERNSYIYKSASKNNKKTQQILVTSITLFMRG